MPSKSWPSFPSRSAWALIALESLHTLDGVDRGRVSALADALRGDHADAADYLASLIGAASKNKGGMSD